MSSVAGTWSSTAFLIPSSLLISIGSSLFSSIFISQASLPSWLEVEGDDIVPGLENPDRKQLETKIGDVVVIRYRGISPKLASCQGECPYPCDYISLVGEEGGVVDDG